MIPILRLALSLFFLMPSISLATDNKPFVIAIIGDSTVCNYPDEKVERGWGQYISEYFSEQSVRTVNLAASGRSTKTFIREGRWKKTLAEKPNLILIQFGHNDSHSKEKPESTDAQTDYRDYLRQYIKEAREIDAIPVLVTPMHRRTFDKKGQLVDILQPYADAMKEVGRESNTPVVDLHAKSRELYISLGPEKCPELSNSPTDFTHFGEQGAREMARLVMADLPGLVPDINNRLK